MDLLNNTDDNIRSRNSITLCRTKIKNKKHRDKSQSDIKESPVDKLDDNEEIIKEMKERMNGCIKTSEMINKRLEFGRNKYGHGVRVNDNTKQYASKWDENSAKNWDWMALEESLDGIIYLIANILKDRKDGKDKNNKREEALNHMILASECIMSLDGE